MGWGWRGGFSLQCSPVSNLSISKDGHINYMYFQELGFLVSARSQRAAPKSVLRGVWRGLTPPSATQASVPRTPPPSLDPSWRPRVRRSFFFGGPGSHHWAYSWKVSGAAQAPSAQVALAAGTPRSDLDRRPLRNIHTRPLPLSEPRNSGEEHGSRVFN